MKTRIEGSRWVRTLKAVTVFSVVGVLLFTAMSAPAAQAGPQLFVDLTASTHSPGVGQPVQFQVVVANQGDVEMQNVVVLLYANGTEGPVPLAEHQRLAAHSEWTFEYNYNGYPQAVLYQTLVLATANPPDTPLRAERPLTIAVQPVAAP